MFEGDMKTLAVENVLAVSEAIESSYFVELY